jgi:UDP-N-acetylglucosamine--N-acetylmuramyl-(pentapeptide) pyrophosphoryl-undecaprenol N-acetylglucosamine transferase
VSEPNEFLQRVIFTGGGSAGHVVPCMPVIERLRARGSDITFVGSRSGLEERLIAPLGIRYRAIATGKLRRYWSLENVRDVGRIVGGVAGAWRMLGELKPNLVFSKGGFVSFPVVFAAWLRRVPVVAHESDLTPGLANRLALPFVDVVCTTFAETRFGRSRVPRVHTGTPLRPTLLTASAERGRRAVDVPLGMPVLLVVGGSLGAETLNRVVHAALSRLTSNYFVVHVCGPGRTNATLEGTPNYRQFEYVSDGWGDLLAAADVVVSRAGANSLYELVVLKKANVLVPLTRQASRGDQLENARYAEAQGWSKVIEEESLSPERLRGALEEVRVNVSAQRNALARAGLGDGTDAVVQVIDQLARRRRPEPAGEK